MKQILLITALFSLFTSVAWSGSYNYISAEDLSQRLSSHQETLLVDIQVQDEFSEHHIAGALATYAYPVKSDADRQKLSAAITEAKQSSAPVVIVCPRGGGGAKRTYDYLLKEGISTERLLILKDGQQGWPYADLLAQK